MKMILAAALAALMGSAAPLAAADAARPCERCAELVDRTLTDAGLAPADSRAASATPAPVAGAPVPSQAGGIGPWSVSTGSWLSGTVAAVYDGDTLELRAADGTLTKVRFSGIDAPEKAQPYGPQAREFTASRALDRPVNVKVIDVDKYGRTVGMVFLSDKTNLCAELLRAGLAWWYKQYSTDQAFGELESAARASSVGLWADESPEAPWDYRRRTRNPR